MTATSGGGCHEDQIPQSPLRRVSDDGKYLSAAAVLRIDSVLASYKERTHHQFWVYIYDERLQMEKAGWSLAAFNAWGVGRESHDDGVVLFVFPKGDSAHPNGLSMQVVVGYGLERRLSDAECVRILRTVIAPLLETGRWDDGIEAGVEAIIAASENRQ